MNPNDIGSKILDKYETQNIAYMSRLNNTIDYWRERIIDLEEKIDKINNLMNTDGWQTFIDELNEYAFSINEAQAMLKPCLDTTYERERYIGQLVGLSVSRNVLYRLKNQLEDAKTQLTNVEKSNHV